MIKMNHETLGELVTMLMGQIEAEYHTFDNYVTAFNKKFSYLNNKMKDISGQSMKGGTFPAYLRDTPLVLSTLILHKYKKILFTDIHGDTFILNNPKWLYQYMSMKTINCSPYVKN